MTTTYKINGKSVSRSVFNRDPKGAGMIRKSYNSGLVIKSEGAAVHPVDRAAAEAHARKRGFTIDFDHHGRPHFTSHAQQKAYLKTIGMHNRDSNS